MQWQPAQVRVISREQSEQIEDLALESACEIRTGSQRGKRAVVIGHECRGDYENICAFKLEDVPKREPASLRPGVFGENQFRTAAKSVAQIIGERRNRLSRYCNSNLARRMHHYVRQA